MSNVRHISTAPSYDERVIDPDITWPMTVVGNICDGLPSEDPCTDEPGRRIDAPF